MPIDKGIWACFDFVCNACGIGKSSTKQEAYKQRTMLAATAPTDKPCNLEWKISIKNSIKRQPKIQRDFASKNKKKVLSKN